MIPSSHIVPSPVLQGGQAYPPYPVLGHCLLAAILMPWAGGNDPAARNTFLITDSWCKSTSKDSGIMKRYDILKVQLTFSAHNSKLSTKNLLY